MTGREINDLFGQPITVVNLGLEVLAKAVKDQGIPMVDVDWQPPSADVPRLHTTRQGVDIDAANAEVCRRIKAGRPVLVGMGIARDVIPGMHERMILHAGPPVAWERMCGPQRGALPISYNSDGLPAQAHPGIKIIGIPNFNPITTVTELLTWRLRGKASLRSLV